MRGERTFAWWFMTARVSPARGLSQAELHLDQALAFDLAASEPIQEDKFDQSSPDDGDA